MRPPFLMAHAGRDALSCHPLIQCERPMADVLDRVVTYGPDFLDRSLKLLTQPKTFRCNVAASKHAVQHAVVFYLCCVTIVFIPEWPLLEAKPSSTTS